MKGYYFWNWGWTHVTKDKSNLDLQIVHAKDIIHEDCEWAATQGAFKQFKSCKDHALEDLDCMIQESYDRISFLEAKREEIKLMTVKDVIKL